MTSVIQQIYYALYMTVSTSLGCACKWIYGRKRMG